VYKNFLYFFLISLLCQSYHAQNQIWGMTNTGGQNNIGVIFSTDNQGNNQNVRYNFSSQDGANPLYTNLLQVNNGMLYGVAYKGGQKNLGTFFSFNPITNLYVKKFDFDSTNGSKPLGSLLQATNNMLYGMTLKGGANDKGVLFEYNPVTDVYTKRVDFNSANGCYPHGSLIQWNDSILYGLASQGGVNNKGILFQYNINSSSFSKVFDFDSINGSYPLGSLLKGSDGMLYGMASGGGTNNLGVLFQFNPQSLAFNKTIDFLGNSNGSSPLGSLVETTNGFLYGMTNNGGAHNMGTLFEYNIASSALIKRIDFDSIIGSYPFGSLLYASDLKLYGMTHSGGQNDVGILFQYNTATNSVVKKIDFNTVNGAKPYGNLIEIYPNITNVKQYTSSEVCMMPNPNNGNFEIKATKMGSYKIIDALGQPVLSIELNYSNHFSVLVEHLPKGIYFIVSNGNNVSITEKIIVTD